MRVRLIPGWYLLSLLVYFQARWSLTAGPLDTLYGRSVQVNVDAAGQNIPGDAANEPSMCIDPVDSARIAVGWRQFNSVNSDFRQSGWAYSTNGGLTWSFPGILAPGIFRSDPVLAAAADGRFYYLGITNAVTFSCDLWSSTNGGADWQRLGTAAGGDKEWLAVDTTTGPGRGNLYQLWSPLYNSFGNDPNRIFSRSTDGGQTWMPAIGVPRYPFFGTLDIGPNGEVYTVGTDGTTFWVSRSTNAWNANLTPVFDLTTEVDLGGRMLYGLPAINPEGLLGQVWLAADRSSTATRGNLYVLCSVTNDPGDWANVMLSRSTDGGQSWSAPIRINDDPPTRHACHWFGTVSVAPNGRVDACWNDTRHSPDNSSSELYYSWSEDGGLTWAQNRPLSPSFNHKLGYPLQQKIGDYIAMVSRDAGACIAYAATFNGEEDIYFVRAELPIRNRFTLVGNTLRISWNAVPGNSYCLETTDNVTTSWAGAAEVSCLVATGSIATIDIRLLPGVAQRFYRVVRQP